MKNSIVIIVLLALLAGGCATTTGVAKNIPGKWDDPAFWERHEGDTWNASNWTYVVARGSDVLNYDLAQQSAEFKGVLRLKEALGVEIREAMMVSTIDTLLTFSNDRWFAFSLMRGKKVQPSQCASTLAIGEKFTCLSGGLWGGSGVVNIIQLTLEEEVRLQASSTIPTFNSQKEKWEWVEAQRDAAFAEMD